MEEDADDQLSFFAMPSEMFSSIRDELQFIIGEKGANGLLFRSGIRCGKSIMRKVVIFNKMRNEPTKNISAIWREIGFGRLVLNKLSDGEYVAIVMDSIEALAIGDIDKPSCNFTRGFLTGILTVLTKKEYYSIEEKCISKGDKFCTYHVSTSKEILYREVGPAETAESV